MNVKITYLNEETETLEAILKQDGNATVATLPTLDYTKIKHIDFGYDYMTGKSDEDGYIVVYQYLYQFGRTADEEHVHSLHELPIYGIKIADKAHMALVTGMEYDFDFVYGTKNGVNYVYTRFKIDGEIPYEDIEIRFYELCGKDANYSGMGRLYRRYLLDSGYITPIKDRMDPILEYTKDSAYIRIRQAWKPVPTPVKEQTLENEPPMHVACTFKQVEEMIDMLKEQGVDKAEICLVGWNKSGHDGRWPNPFPVEPKLGGEEDLKHLIKYAQKNGYQITCHTNSTDSYAISDMHDTAKNSIFKKDLTPAIDAAWSGGLSYPPCAIPALEMAKDLLPKIAKLGFKGSHYIDVLSVVNPRKCYHPEHPVNNKQCIELFREMADVAIENFGGFSSEGTFYTMCNKLNYGLYTTFSSPFANATQFEDEGEKKCDRMIPLWQIVFHGTVLSNPFTCTVNSAIKDERSRLKSIEFSSRPTIYFHSAFMTGEDGKIMSWMGFDDMTCIDSADMLRSVKAIKKSYDEYKERRYLQTEFMESHEEIKPGVYEIIYSDGSKIIVDYNNETWKLTKA